MPAMRAGSRNDRADDRTMAWKRRPSTPEAFADARAAMVRDQIAARGSKDRRVLDALGKVERHRFVPETGRREAYEDHPLPIGEGQTISQPYVVAFMTEALHPEPSDRVLEVGTGSGYQAAILAELCAEVYTIEVHAALAAPTAARLAELGYTNVQVRCGDGHAGWPDAAPFDVLIAACAASHVPEPLTQQLAARGRMMIPVDRDGGQDLGPLRKKDGELERESVLPVRFVPMVRASGEPY
jgi:protein-L-isoaspartate(D-aspartate) O-methyltransferase